MANLVRASIVIPVVLALVMVAPVPRADTRSAMADAMVRMMEAMGLFGAPGGALPGVPQIGSSPLGMAGWPAGYGAIPGLPGSGQVPMPGPGGASQDPMSGMGEMLQRFYPGTAASGAVPWAIGPLEGVWEGSDEGLLIVQGARYRIYAPFSGYIDGDLRITGDRVELTNRRESFTREFEYAMDQGRLVFRDHEGQVYLYRRLDLGASPDPGRKR